MTGMVTPKGITCIADVGSNWRISDSDIVNRLNIADVISQAAKAGVDIIKWQAWASNQAHGLPDRWQLPPAYYTYIIDLCKQYNITLMFTPCDVDSVEALMDADPTNRLTNWKIRGDDANNKTLINAIKKRTAMDTLYITINDMSTYVDAYVNTMGIPHVVMMHGTRTYPTLLSKAKFRQMDRLAEFINSDAGHRLALGYSSHVAPDDATLAAMLAVAKGATALEFHITAASAIDTPDRPVSLTIDEAARLIGKIKYIDRLLRN